MKQVLGSVAEYLAAFKGSERFGPQIVAHRLLPANESEFAGPVPCLPRTLEELLGKMGIRHLYRHQAQAVNLILQGRNVVVATPTASGKSLIYNLPVFARILADPGARALYLFPLKALARDQVKTITTMAAAYLPAAFADQGRLPAAIYDGGTSSYLRKKNQGQSAVHPGDQSGHAASCLLPYHDLRGHLLFQNKAGKTVRLPVNFRDSANRIMENGKKPAQGQSSVL